MTDTDYIVVRNDEEQYAIWPAGKDVPAGWTVQPCAGTREACLEYVERTWTDMRPKSLREAMDRS